MLAFIAHALCGALGVLYPTYRSYLAMKASDHERCMEWLMYWSVLALVGVPEFYVDRVLSTSPLYLFYTLIKLGVLFYLVHPRIEGFRQVFLRYLEPHFVVLWTEGEKEPVTRMLLRTVRPILSL